MCNYPNTCSQCCEPLPHAFTEYVEREFQEHSQFVRNGTTEVVQLLRFCTPHCQLDWMLQKKQIRIKRKVTKETVKDFADQARLMLSRYDENPKKFLNATILFDDIEIFLELPNV